MRRGRRGPDGSAFWRTTVGSGKNKNDVDSGEGQLGGKVWKEVGDVAQTEKAADKRKRSFGDTDEGVGGSGE